MAPSGSQLDGKSACYTGQGTALAHAAQAGAGRRPGMELSRAAAPARCRADGRRRCGSAGGADRRVYAASFPTVFPGVRQKVFLQALCTWLADVELSANRTHRRNHAPTELGPPRDDRRTTRPPVPVAGPHRARSGACPPPFLRTADDHHQQFIRAHQRDRRNAATLAPARPWLRPRVTFAASVVAIPKPRSHRARAGTGVLPGAESSTTSNSRRSGPSR